MLVEHLHRQAEHDEEPPYIPPNQPASYYDVTRHMFSTTHCDPRHIDENQGLSFVLTTIVC